jgi:hypothetical protein
MGMYCYLREYIVVYNILWFISMSRCLQCVVVYKLCLYVFVYKLCLYLVVYEYFFLKLMCCKHRYFCPSVSIYLSGYRYGIIVPNEEYGRDQGMSGNLSIDGKSMGWLHQ